MLEIPIDMNLNNQKAIEYLWYFLDLILIPLSSFLEKYTNMCYRRLHR